MDKISALLPKVLRKRGLKDEADASHVVFAADAWLRSHSAPEDAMAQKLRNGELIIKVEHSASAQECHALSHVLLHELKTEFSNLPLDRIRILRK